MTYDSERARDDHRPGRATSGPQFEDDLNTQPIGAVVLVDARAERDLGHGFSLFVTGQNLFDRRYLVGRAGIDTEGAPRTFELGVGYHANASPAPAHR